ncbi:PTS sugar transporter subunit IIC [Companilactobacillus huachuanensis]|uniref:Permease IIC component n=1 Tax=Companilactobacillus huachuanensis TaxID=2559914 RepID=A0ABW1RQB9_9LACO|nr:PTS transporter subunit EIIC [Companilactobacillus huachuanensis]
MSKEGTDSAFITKLSSFSGKLTANKYIISIRDAFGAALPLTIIASFFVLINNLLLDPKIGLFKNIPGRQFITNIGIQAYNGTLGMMGLIVTFLIGYYLGKQLGSDGVLDGVISVAALVTLIPNIITITSNSGKAFKASAVLTQTQTSAEGMFLGIFAALIATRLLEWISKSDKLKISMPDGVPPAIANSFNGLIPALFVISIFGIFEETIVALTGMNVPDLMIKILQAPLVGGFQNYFGITFYGFLTCLLFTVGIHGDFVLGAVSSPILLTAFQQNMSAVKAGKVAPNIVTQPYVDCYIYITMISLVIAIFIGSHKANYRSIAKIGAVPALFNISEPLLFGLPVVFNPILAIPYVLVPICSSTLAYFATAFGLVAKTYVVVPWVTPAILSGFLATGGDWRASVLQIVIIIAGVFIYLPFVYAANRVKDPS